MADNVRRNESAQALRDVLAKLEREGADRIDRGRVEELGRRYGIDPDEACRIFVDSRGTVREGELIGSDEEGTGWMAAALEHVPSAGRHPACGG